MNNSTAFLNSLGKRLSAMSLYGPGHPSRDRAMEQVIEDMSLLLRENAFPVFNFLDGDVVYEDSVLSELRQWEWSTKLAAAGVERLEITPGTSKADLESFLDEVHARMSLEDSGASIQEVAGQTSIRYGEVGVEGLSDDEPDDIPTATMKMNLREEADTIGWLHGEVLRSGEVPVSEAVAVVKLLSLAMHSERDVVVPLVHLKKVDQYTTTHSINVSMLSMGLAEFLNFASVDVRAISADSPDIQRPDGTRLDRRLRASPDLAGRGVSGDDVPAAAAPGQPPDTSLRHLRCATHSTSVPSSLAARPGGGVHALKGR